MKLDFMRISRDHIAPLPQTQRIEVPAPPGVSPSALDIILDAIEVMNRRQTRIETRLVRLMKDQGLDASGRPVDML